MKKACNWDKGTYVISFGGIDLFRNSASFSVTSNVAIEEYKRQFKTSDCTIRHHPDDFLVLIDIVDYVVLSEGGMNTYFPNAKPGYERVVPHTPQK